MTTGLSVRREEEHVNVSYFGIFDRDTGECDEYHGIFSTREYQRCLKELENLGTALISGDCCILYLRKNPKGGIWLSLQDRSVRTFSTSVELGDLTV